jgi:hypothetical protein
MIDRPTVFSLAQLKSLPRTEMCVKHHCVEGWSAVASWQGVRLSTIAGLVGLSPRVKHVELRSFDSNYWSSWDLESALHPQTLLAYGMNGHQLYPDHGAPLRVYSAVKLGYKNVKYLTEVNFLPDKTGGTGKIRATIGTAASSVRAKPNILPMAVIDMKGSRHPAAAVGAKRVLILGGGFGGIYDAIELERILARRGDLEVTLVTRDNYFLFTPMLPEVAAGELELSTIINPLRRLLKRVKSFVGIIEASISKRNA